MTMERDAITDAVAELKKRAERRKTATDWEKVVSDLRAILAELALANSPAVRGLRGETYYRVGIADASITEARELLGDARNAFAAAKEFPRVLENFAARTYGEAGWTSVPWAAMKAYTDALFELELCLRSLEEMFKETLSRAGRPQGMKGPLLERVIGTPLEHFLQRLIRLWADVTGTRALGKCFEGVAKQLIETTLPDDDSGGRPEIKDLKRQIENAKRRGEVVQTSWTYKTDVMQELKQRNVRRRTR